MKLHDLIVALEQLRRKHGGDIPVKVQTLTHKWDPEPTFKQEPEPHILLNP